MKITDEMLKEALDVVARREYENRPRNEKHIFSKRFERRMHRAVKRIRRGTPYRGGARELPRLYPVHSKKRIVLIAAIITMLIGTTAIAQPFLYRLFYREIRLYEDHVVFTPLVEEELEDQGEFVKCRLTRIPQGYEPEFQEYSEVFHNWRLGYVNEEGKVFHVRQSFLGESSANITANGMPVEEITVGDWRGYFVPDDRCSSVIFSDGRYMFLVNGWFSKEELIYFAEGIELE